MPTFEPELKISYDLDAFNPITFNLPILITAKNPPVELVSEYSIRDDIMRDNPMGAEEMIKSRLARELARRLIEEDLIQIISNHNIEEEQTTFKAKIKVLQE